MQITSTARAEHFEVKLKGRMDASWSDHVARVLSECVQSGQHVISVDMAEVDYISSAGIRILVLYARQLKTIQGSFSVVNASGPVKRVLELSGLDSLFGAAAGSAGQREPNPRSGAVQFAEAGASSEVYDLDANAELRVHWPGNPQPWLSGAGVPETSVGVDFAADAMGIGLGGFAGGQPDETPCFGEFLGVAGAVVCLPADGANNPDYMLQQGDLTPSIQVGYGMIGFGGFRKLLRFDKGPQRQGLSLSSVIGACLRANGGAPAGIVIVAETASLTGASLKSMPSSGSGSAKPAGLFAFPAVRDQLSFTTEPAFPSTTSLVVGFAAEQARADGLRLLKPLMQSGQIHGHFHAAAFPYQPLRKGKVELNQTVRPLFESGQVLGVLHLLNDWREINGAGESRFLRGACWFAPLAV